MEFIKGIPHLVGKSLIFIMVDKLKKYAHVYAISHPYTTFRVAHILLEHIFKLHGMPKIIINDKDPNYVRKFWQELFKLQGFQLKHSFTYHPQTNGKIEVVNKPLETYLHYFSS